jgi:hypothetical protein
MVLWLPQHFRSCWTRLNPSWSHHPSTDIDSKQLMHFLDLTSHQLWFQLEIERENGRVTGHFTIDLPTIMYASPCCESRCRAQDFWDASFRKWHGYIKYSFILHFHFDLFHFLLASLKRKTCKGHIDRSVFHTVLLGHHSTLLLYRRCCCARVNYIRTDLLLSYLFGWAAKLLMLCCCARIMAVFFSILQPIDPAGEINSAGL